MTKKRVCPDCSAVNSLEYDVGSNGYVCDSCGTVFGCESVECGDFDEDDD